MTVCGKTGAAGASGAVPVAPANIGRSGVEGRRLIQPFADLAFIPTTAPLAWLSAALHDAELLIVNQRYELATSELNWILTIINSCDRKGKTPVLDEAAAKALALLGTIRSGIDVFGRNLNYVPLTSFELGEALVNRQLAYLTPVETAVAELKRQDAAQQALLQSTKGAVDKFGQYEKDADKDISQLAERLKGLQDEIQRLFYDLINLHGQLMSAAKEFKEAVQAKSGCQFGDVVKLAAMVTTVVATAGAGAAALGAVGTAYQSYSAWSSLAAKNATWANAKADFSAISGFVKPVSGSIDDFRAKYNDAQDAINKAFPQTPAVPDALRLSDDYAKIVAAKGDFDKAIQPYLKMSAAKKYKAVMDRFVAVAETRNNKIVEHDGVVAQLYEARSRVQFERRRMQAVAATTLKDFDSRRGANLAFLEAGLTSLKWKLIRQLTGLESALEYMTGNTINVDYNDFSVTALKAITGDLLLQYADAMESFGQEAAYGEAYAIKIKNVLDDHDIDALLNGEKVTFSLGLLEDDLFKGFYGVQTGRVSITGKDGKPLPGAVNLSIQHLGRSVMRLKDGSHRVYTHVPVATAYVQNDKGVVNAKGQLLERVQAGQSRYVGVSPYGPWRLQLNNRPKNNVIAAIKNGELAFDVRFRPLPI